MKLIWQHCLAPSRLPFVYVHLGVLSANLKASLCSTLCDMAPPTKKNIRLTLKQKMKIIKMKRDGKRNCGISREFSVGESTVRINPSSPGKAHLVYFS